MLAPAPSEWLPPNYEAYVISDAVENTDLSAFYTAYEGPRGNPPYHPNVMIKILAYAYARGVRGSRRIERMLWEDVPMRVLAGNQQPDRWASSHFLRKDADALVGLFEQTVRGTQRAGLMRLREASNQASDCPKLVSLADQLAANTGTPPRLVLADAGTSLKKISTPVWTVPSTP